MSILLLKSCLSIILVILALNAMFTMFELLGRNEKRYKPEKLKKIHKINGIIYIILYLLIAYFCINYLMQIKTELSIRATLHYIFALTILFLIGLKISFVKIYRQFYNQIKTIGLLITLITFVMTGISGGYYLIVTKFGTETPIKMDTNQENTYVSKVIIRTDEESIRKGKELYESKCSFCHDAYGTKWIVGPSLKSILKKSILPLSKKPATAENIANQLKNPYKDMPSFSYLPDEDMLNIISFLNTL